MSGRREVADANLHADRLRVVGLLLAGVAGAVLGILLGLAWQLARDGTGIVALAIATLGVATGLVVLFQLVQARAVVALLEAAPPTPRNTADLERRISALEEQLDRLGEQV